MLILSNQTIASDINKDYLSKNTPPTQQCTGDNNNGYLSIKDDEVSKVAKEAVMIAVNTARQSLRINLDYSEESIKQVETIIEQFESQKTANITDKDIYRIGVIYGSYIGEVYIKHYGGTWVTITTDGHRFPGVKGKDGSLFWPWNRVVSRISEGNEYNLWHYYKNISSNTIKEK